MKESIATIKLAASDFEIERLLKGSVLLEAEKNAHNRTAYKLNTVVRFLNTFLSEFEGAWDNDEECASPEIAKDYLEAAKFMRDTFGRTGDRIDAIKSWYDNYLPFGN